MHFKYKLPNNQKQMVVIFVALNLYEFDFQGFNIKSGWLYLKL